MSKKPTTKIALGIGRGIQETLKEIRATLGYSQAQMAEVLGVSRPTYSDLENGKTEMTVSQLERLSEKTGLSLGALLGRESLRRDRESIEPFAKFKKMILFAIHCGADEDGRITKTKLAKLLYLCDFGWFYEHLNPMSGLMYRRIRYGPVPREYFIALEDLLDEHQIHISDKRAQMISAVEKRPPTAGLSPEEQAFIKKICRKWKGRNTADIVEFTHEQLPWKLCGENEEIPYELIIQEEPANVF